MILAFAAGILASTMLSALNRITHVYWSTSCKSNVVFYCTTPAALFILVGITFDTFTAFTATSKQQSLEENLQRHDVPPLLDAILVTDLFTILCGTRELLKGRTPLLLSLVSLGLWFCLRIGLFHYQTSLEYNQDIGTLFATLVFTFGLATVFESAALFGAVLSEQQIASKHLLQLASTPPSVTRSRVRKSARHLRFI